MDFDLYKNIEELGKLSLGDKKLFRVLLWGYFRGLQTDELGMLLVKYVTDIFLSPIIRQCFIDSANEDQIDMFSQKLLEVLTLSFSRTVAAHINKLFEKCSSRVKEEIINHFIVSKHRTLRKYVYQKRLDLFPNSLMKVFEILSLYPDETDFLLTSMIYNYSDSFIDENFHMLIKISNIPEQYLRKLYLRKAILKEEDWTWLRDNYPGCMLYAAAKRGHYLSDDICLMLARNNLTAIESAESGYFIFWCLAVLHKWEVIKQILPEFKSIESKKDAKFMNNTDFTNHLESPEEEIQ